MICAVLLPETFTNYLLIYRNFLNSNWCMQEFYMAHQKVTEGKTGFLIPILLEDIPLGDLPRDMQMYLRTYTYIDAREYDINTLRKKIRFAMPDTPFTKLMRNQHFHDEDEEMPLVEGIELQNNIARQGIEENRVEGMGGILRLLEADGSILEIRYPARVQSDSEESYTSDDSDNFYDDETDIV